MAAVILLVDCRAREFREIAFSATERCVEVKVVLGVLDSGRILSQEARVDMCGRELRSR